MDMHPIRESNDKIYEYAYSIEKIDRKDTLHGDLTGRFPHKSSRGNQYLLVIYDYDANLIWAGPLTSLHARTIIKA